jgi:gamma-glutamylcyclotransferase (GGCT)/AIG2-like uncharacterized protein YtfP
VTPNALFVYGTLMRGRPNHPRIEAASRIEAATVPGSLFGTPAGYPALVAGEGIVHGELCFFSDLGAILSDLDEFEGPPYRRIRCEATTADGRKHAAWCYAVAEIPSGAWPIPSGRW